jgi:hypothetical protein
LRTIADVEYTTIECVDWSNNRRRHGRLDRIPPDEYEATCCAHVRASRLRGVSTIKPFIDSQRPSA